MEEATRKTALHDWHVGQNARMAVFAGYDMPLWYPQGAKAEHLAVIRSAGIFDTSHMSVITVKGAGARPLLQFCFSRDLEQCLGKKKGPLVKGRCTYGFFLNTEGHVIDDAIVYQFNPMAYLVVANAGMGSELAAHLGRQTSDNRVEIVNLTGRIGKMDIQGPAAARLVKELIKDPDPFFDHLIYFSFKGSLGLPSEVNLLDGTPLIIARTGYTGEFGFELFIQPADFPKLWQKTVSAGQDFGALTCGLAARDSLRVGAVLPLSHQDIGDWPFVANPWLFALPWLENRSGFTKDFLGASALLEQEAMEHTTEHTLPFAGYDPRKIVVDQNTAVTDLQGHVIGQVLTCATDMAIDRLDDGRIISIATPITAGRPADFIPRGLCCGFIKVNCPLAVGEKVILTDRRRHLTVEIREDIRPDRTARRPITEMLQGERR